MKCYLSSIVIAVIGLCLCTCSNWTTSFEEIETDVVRTLDFIYRNKNDTLYSEAMPGDTVQLFAYFSGAPIRTLEWKVSFNVVESITGSDTALQIQQLQYDTIPVHSTDFSNSTYCSGIQFQIPKDIMYKHSMLNESIIQSSLGISKLALLNLVDTLVTIDPALWDSIPAIKQFMPMFKPNINKILQLLSAPIEIFVTSNGQFKTKSRFYIRYKNFFRKVPSLAVYANKNPQISFMTLYKVKKDGLNNFKINTMTSFDTTYCLYIRDSALIPQLGINRRFTDTVLVDSTFSYYIAVDTGAAPGISQLDTSFINDMYSEFELFYTLWFYSFDKEQKKGVNPDELLKISPSGSLLSDFYPPLNKRITCASIWGHCYDDLLGEPLRPSGSALREKKLYFRYK